MLHCKREGRKKVQKLAYRDEVPHGKVVCQGRSGLLVLALELRSAGYHQLLRGVPNSERLDFNGHVRVVRRESHAGSITYR
jgi:hypothetical protein